MTDHLPVPVELTDAELDAVAAGANANAGAGGLVALAIGAASDNVEVLNGNKVSILDNSLNGNKTNVGAGVLVNLLGGPAVIRSTQTT
jgi:hypothetical protein